MSIPLLTAAALLIIGCGSSGDTAPSVDNASSSISSANPSSSSSSSTLSSSASSAASSPVSSSSSSVSLSSSLASSSRSSALFTDTELNAYYANALGLSGNALKNALHGIIETATFLSYDEVYTLMAQTDADLTQRDEAYVILLYSRASVPAEEKCHTVDTGCWNREHLWPKSLGVGYDASASAYTDLHHLRPADAQVNMDRSNRRFAEASTPYPGIEGTYYDDAAWSWEPSDGIKGDVARALLYMTVRYEGTYGEPDLELLPHDESTQRPADLCTMLEWNRLDPVSRAEQRRNDAVFHYQKNRNPFIDHAAWADDIYAEQCAP